jgi:hypothetical protein
MHLATAALDYGKDQALYRMALSSAFSDSGPQSASRTLGYLQQLVARYPKSSYVPEARLIIDLIQEIQKLRADVRERDERVKRLAGELERLKKIDMQRRAPRAP